MLPKGWDWKSPDYASVYAQRMKSLHWLRESPTVRVPAMREYYAQHPADFISDWGITFDPRLAPERITILPFVLFDKQREWVDVVLRKWRAREPLITEKSRDGGFTWLAISLSCTLCLFNDGLAIGCGSRKAEYVDEAKGVKAILPKGRMFMRNIPPEFRGNWVEWRDAPQMRIGFPDSGSYIGGEGGGDIGRGDRTSIYFVDEASHIKQAENIDAALSQTTNCRIDVSSVRGMNNTFAKKRHEGKIEVFVFDWRQDPRKDQAWYDKQCDELDPVVVAQEIDRDYSASLEGIVIPQIWVKSAVGARQALGVAPAGLEWASFDVADEGKDRNAVAAGRGIDVTSLEEWSGKGSDIHANTQRAFDIVEKLGIYVLRYDADGMGAGVRAAARVINDQRKARGQRIITVVPFRGSGGVIDPEGIVEGTIGENGEKGRTNDDYYLNHKAQGWSGLSRLFRNTHRAIAAHKDGRSDYDPNDIISLDPNLPMLFKLCTELSQPTRIFNGIGRMLIDKVGKGVKSPNLADSVMIGKAVLGKEPFVVTAVALQQIAAASRAGMGRGIGGRRRFR